MIPLNSIPRCAGIAIILTLTLFATGCYGSRETDDIAYVLVIGIDKAEDGKERITYQLAVPSAKSGGGAGGDNSGMGEQGSGQQKPWIINSFVSPAYGQARMLLNANLSRYPNLTHITAFIISEETAREGLGPRVSYLTRNRDFRGSLFLIIVKGTAEEYIRQNKPALENQIFKFYENSLSSAAEGSNSLQVHLHDFYNRLKNSGGSAYAAYSAINPKTGEDKPAGSKAPEQKGDSYRPGEVPRIGTENTVEFLGLAVFRGDKMVGALNSNETRAAAILLGKFTSGYVSVVDPLEPKKDAISLKIFAEHKPKITVDLNGGAPIFDVAIKIGSEIQGITSGINYEAPDYRELLETQIANMLKGQIMMMIKHTQELGTDPAGFGLYLRPHFKNTGELDQADPTALYQAADIRVNVTAKLRRTGLKWRTTPSIEE